MPTFPTEISDPPKPLAITADRFAITVPGVHPVMIERADYCTQHSGGNRAVRAACHVIPPAKDCLQSMVERYVNAHI